MSKTVTSLSQDPHPDQTGNPHGGEHLFTPSSILIIGWLAFGAQDPFRTTTYPRVQTSVGWANLQPTFHCTTATCK
jgi:hypothetical protein